MIQDKNIVFNPYETRFLEQRSITNHLGVKMCIVYPRLCIYRLKKSENSKFKTNLSRHPRWVVEEVTVPYMNHHQLSHWLDFCTTLTIVVTYRYDVPFTKVLLGLTSLRILVLCGGWGDGL